MVAGSVGRCRDTVPAMMLSIGSGNPAGGERLTGQLREELGARHDGSVGVGDVRDSGNLGGGGCTELHVVVDDQAGAPIGEQRAQVTGPGHGGRAEEVSGRVGQLIRRGHRLHLG